MHFFVGSSLWCAACVLCIQFYAFSLTCVMVLIHLGFLTVSISSFSFAKLNKKSLESKSQNSVLKNTLVSPPLTGWPPKQCESGSLRSLNTIRCQCSAHCGQVLRRGQHLPSCNISGCFFIVTNVKLLCNLTFVYFTKIINEPNNYKSKLGSVETSYYFD